MPTTIPTSTKLRTLLLITTFLCSSLEIRAEYAESFGDNRSTLQKASDFISRHVENVKQFARKHADNVRQFASDTAEKVQNHPAVRKITDWVSRTFTRKPTTPQSIPFEMGSGADESPASEAAVGAGADAGSASSFARASRADAGSGTPPPAADLDFAFGDEGDDEVVAGDGEDGRTNTPSDRRFFRGASPQAASDDADDAMRQEGEMLQQYLQRTGATMSADPFGLSAPPSAAAAEAEAEAEAKEDYTPLTPKQTFGAPSATYDADAFAFPPSPAAVPPASPW